MQHHFIHDGDCRPTNTQLPGMHERLHGTGCTGITLRLRLGKRELRQGRGDRKPAVYGTFKQWSAVYGLLCMPPSSNGLPWAPHVLVYAVVLLPRRVFPYDVFFLYNTVNLVSCGQGKFQLLPPAPPYYPFPRGNIHTRGNIRSFTVGWHECCDPTGGVGVLCNVPWRRLMNGCNDGRQARCTGVRRSDAPPAKHPKPPPVWCTRTRTKSGRRWCTGFPQHSPPDPRLCPATGQSIAHCDIENRTINRTIDTNTSIVIFISQSLIVYLSLYLSVNRSLWCRK